MNEQEEARVLAEKVMGWDKVFNYLIQGHQYITRNGEHKFYARDWHPKYNLTQAMMVAEKFPSYSMHKDRHGTCHCVLWAENMIVLGASDFNPTLEAAICAAAIKTVKKEE